MKNERGPRLLAAIAAAMAAMTAVIVIVTGEPGAVIRWTARTSLVLFALAYVARPLVQLRPSAGTKALLAHRKWIGLGFATSHAFHLGGIVWLASPDFGAFVRDQDPTIVVAAATFVVLGAMAVTSIEAIKRKVPARSWKRLHWTGMQLSWLSFATTYATAIGASVVYVVPTVVLVGIAGVRVAAWARRRATAQSSRSRARRA